MGHWDLKRNLMRFKSIFENGQQISLWLEYEPSYLCVKHLQKRMPIFNHVYKSVRFKSKNSYTLFGLVSHSEHLAIDDIHIPKGRVNAYPHILCQLLRMRCGLFQELINIKCYVFLTIPGNVQSQAPPSGEVRLQLHLKEKTSANSLPTCSFCL